MANRKSVTLRDVAESVGVSPSSVSTVLRDNPGVRISKETHSKILNALVETGYIYKSRGSPRRSGRASLTVLVFSRHALDNPHIELRLKGIEKGLWKHHGRMMVNMLQEAHTVVSDDNNGLLDDVNGVIFISKPDPYALKVLRARGIPAVILGAGEYRDDVDMVYGDPTGYARLGLSHLQSLGHSRIGFALGPLPHFSYETSKVFFRAYLAENHHDEASASYLTIADGAHDSGDLIRSLLTLPNKPTALLGQCREGAIAALQVGVRIPEDVSVLSYDEPGPVRERPLSYLCCNEPYAGEMAVELLLMRRERPHEPVKHIVLPMQIHHHGSCRKLT